MATGELAAPSQKLLPAVCLQWMPPSQKLLPASPLESRGARSHSSQTSLDAGVHSSKRVPSQKILSAKVDRTEDLEGHVYDYLLQDPPFTVARLVQHVALGYGSVALGLLEPQTVYRQLSGIVHTVLKSKPYQSASKSWSNKTKAIHRKAIVALHESLHYATFFDAFVGVQEDNVVLAATLTAAAVGSKTDLLADKVLERERSRKRASVTRPVSPSPFVVSKKAKAIKQDENINTPDDISTDDEHEHSLEPPSTPVFVDIPRNVKLLEPHYYFLPCGADITGQFYRFQKHALALARSHTLTLESHVHEIMSLSSTLLLKPNEHSPILLSHMNADLLESLFRLGKDLTEFRPYDIPNELELEMRKACKMAKTGKNENEIRKLFAKHIASYADSNEEDIRIIDTMYHLYTTLPLHPIEPERQSELDLCVSYLRPVLARFVDVAGSIHGSWPNTASSAASAEKNALKDGSRARQPDFKLFTLNQYREAYECGFGEVKPASKCTDKYACNLDLLRLSRFAKQALDELYRKKVFVKALPVFQCIGEKLWMYLFFHAADGLYVMMETGCIGNIPLLDRAYWALSMRSGYLWEFGARAYTLSVRWKDMVGHLLL
ncbi:hypothetical protein HDU85_006546 [Gaertneriomyces sp. JEL0708]|nr:hypothetical protein HDU85_006546 [Gaertneriomyces sp. JEL0708]